MVVPYIKFSERIKSTAKKKENNTSLKKRGLLQQNTNLHKSGLVVNGSLMSYNRSTVFFVIKNLNKTIFYYYFIFFDFMFLV